MMADQILIYEDASCVLVADEQIVIRPSEPEELSVVAIFEGPKGDPGADVPASYVSGGVIAFQVVYMASTGAVLAANANNPTHAGRIVGIALAVKSPGQMVQVRRSGSVENPAWSLTPGERYFLQAGGEIGTNTDGLALVQKIGLAESATSLLLQIEPPVIL